MEQQKMTAQALSDQLLIKQKDKDEFEIM